MVNQGADVPEVASNSDSGTQGLLDLTPEGQDSAVTTDTLVDTAQAAENTAPVAGTEGTPGVATEQAPAPEQPQTQSSEQVDPQSFTGKAAV